MFITNTFNMGKESLCRFSASCQLYQQKTEKKGEELLIYKNVFCHRGLDGWNNCKHYLDLINGGNSSSKVLDAR